MNVKQLKKTLAQLPPECDNMTVVLNDLDDDGDEFVVRELMFVGQVKRIIYESPELHWEEDEDGNEIEVDERNSVEQDVIFIGP